MIMVGQSARLRQPLSRRQRRAMWATIAVLAAGVAGASTYGTIGGASHASGHGCVTVIVAGPTGGQELHSCGAAAKRWCATEARRSGPVASAAAPQCALAGYRFPARARL